MRARYYEPGTGRFVSEDPAQDGGNWYAYSKNSPVCYADPTGKFPWLVALGILAFGLINFGIGFCGDAAYQLILKGQVDWREASDMGLVTLAGGIFAALATEGVSAMVSFGAFAIAAAVFCVSVSVGFIVGGIRRYQEGAPVGAGTVVGAAFGYQVLLLALMGEM